MEYIRTEANGQLFLEPETKEYLNIPSCLYGFKNEETTTETALSGRKVFCFRGKLNVEEEERQCKCGKRTGHCFTTSVHRRKPELCSLSS